VAAAPAVQTSPNGVAQVLLNGGNKTGGLTGSYSVDSAGRGTGTVNVPAFGSADIVFYVIDASAKRAISTNKEQHL
jgi:hypothetical protein